MELKVTRSEQEGPNVPTPGNDYEGPNRAAAHTMLRRRIQELRDKADGLEALLKVTPERGPAEEALWELLTRARDWQ